MPSQDSLFNKVIEKRTVSKTVIATSTGVKDHMSAWTMAAAGSVAAAFGAAVVLIKRKRVDK